MIVKRILLALFLVVSMAACETTTTGRADWDREADFTSYRGYAWISEHPLIVAEGSTQVINPLTEGRVMAAVERELAAKGYTKAVAGEPADFVLSFTIGTREKIRVDSYPDPYFRYSWNWYHRHWPHWNYYEVRTVTRSYTEGTLAIDIFDGEQKTPVWHGWATRQVRGSDIKDPNSAINEAVGAIMVNFPPG